MLEFDYNLLNDIFKTVWQESDFSAITIALKAAAISFLLVRYSWIIFKSWADKKKLGDEGGSFAISPKQLLTYLSFCLGVAFYDTVLFWLDTILGSLLSTYSSLDVNSVTVPLANSSQEQKDAIANASAFEALKMVALEIFDILTSPTLWMLSIMKVIAWIFDLIIYGLFISERFFVLLILKFTGPLALCLGMIPKMKGVLFKWLTLYARWYLLIIPYILVNLTVNAFIKSYELIFSKMNSEVFQTIGENIETPMILLIIFLKFMLYRTAKNTYNELIDINMNEDD